VKRKTLVDLATSLPYGSLCFQLERVDSKKTSGSPRSSLTPGRTMALLNSGGIKQEEAEDALDLAQQSSIDAPAIVAEAKQGKASKMFNSGPAGLTESGLTRAHLYPRWIPPLRGRERSHDHEASTGVVEVVGADHQARSRAGSLLVSRRPAKFNVPDVTTLRARSQSGIGSASKPSARVPSNNSRSAASAVAATGFLETVAVAWRKLAQKRRRSSARIAASTACEIGLPVARASSRASSRAF